MRVRSSAISSVSATQRRCHSLLAFLGAPCGDRKRRSRRSGRPEPVTTGLLSFTAPSWVSRYRVRCQFGRLSASPMGSQRAGTSQHVTCWFRDHTNSGRSFGRGLRYCNNYRCPGRGKPQTPAPIRSIRPPAGTRAAHESRRGARRRQCRRCRHLRRAALQSHSFEQAARRSPERNRRCALGKDDDRTRSGTFMPLNLAPKRRH